MKKMSIAMIAMGTMMLATVSGCGQKPTEPTKVETTATAAASAATEVTTAAAVSLEVAETTTAAAAADSGSTAADGSLAGPYIVTSCGQSPGAVMVNMVATQAGLTSANDNGLTAEGLQGASYKTLIVTTGTSMKGMGAAGTDVDAEIARCVELIKAAKEQGITVVGAHVEGMARRTDTSDTASIEAVMELADQILVIEESDSDGYFTQYAAEHNKPLLKVKDSLEIATVLK